MRLRIREITYQLCQQLQVKGCTSRKIQQEFLELRKRYWGRRFWAREYFCTTSGNVTNQTILNHIENYAEDELTDNRR